jgi:hypothetical protein
MIFDKQMGDVLSKSGGRHSDFYIKKDQKH